MNRTLPADTVVMMVKRPICGAVKSRLAAGIGTVGATSIYRAMMYNSIRTLAADTRWRLVLAVSPDPAVHETFWPRNIALVSQGGGCLGDRMQRIMDTMAPGKIIITGSDVAALRPIHLARAFKKLGPADAVFSAADDGGYSLVGLKRIPRILNIFANVRWSSTHTLGDTLHNLDGCKTAYIEPLPDIDTPGDWHKWKSRGRAGRLCL